MFTPSLQRKNKGGKLSKWKKQGWLTAQGVDDEGDKSWANLSPLSERNKVGYLT